MHNSTLRWPIAVLLCAITFAGCRDEGGDSDVPGDGLNLNPDAMADADIIVAPPSELQTPRAYRVDEIVIDEEVLGTIATLLNGLTETDLRCGVLNVIAYAYDFEADSDVFKIDVGGGGIAEASEDQTVTYCENNSQAVVPTPDPRIYDFLGEETTELAVPAEILNIDRGEFTTTEAFDLLFPVIVPGTQTDPEFLYLPLRDVSFGGNISKNEEGLFELTNGKILGAILMEDADDVEVDLNPNDSTPGIPISQLLASVDMNYPPDSETKTGWQISVDAAAIEVEFETGAEVETESETEDEE